MPDRPTAVGLDLGSRLTKIVRLEGTTVTDAEVFDTGHAPAAHVLRALETLQADTVVATGYGRGLAESKRPVRTVTEIRAAARAARLLDPEAASVLDVGGQDTKAIELVAGGFGRFEMNQRCAAGTGRFLEVMARALDLGLDELGPAALEADAPVALDSVCTVFAESEVVSLVARGEDRRRIAWGLHVATARRIAALASRIDLGGRTLLIGGVARNPAMVKALREELPTELVVPDRPVFAVATGAALLGLDLLA